MIKLSTKRTIIFPKVNKRVEHRQFQQKVGHDSSARKRNLAKGDTVFAQNFGTGSRWLPAVIQEVTGPVSFLVRLENGRLVRRHQVLVNAPARVLYGNYWARESSRRSCSTRRSRVLHELRELSRAQ